MGWLSKLINVPTPEDLAQKAPPIGNPEPSALEMRSPAQCRACTGGYGDGCCAYHQSKWDVLIERQEHLSKHQQKEG